MNRSRALLNGKASAFQAEHAGSIPAARSRILWFVDCGLWSEPRSATMSQTTGHNPQATSASWRNSMVECNLPKVEVASSNLVARSNSFGRLAPP